MSSADPFADTSDPFAPQPEGDFELDGDGLGSGDVGGGASIDREGWYHLEVSDVIPELSTVSDSGKDKSPAMRFDLTVMESTKGQSPAGSKHFHRIYVGSKGGGKASDGARNAALRFGLGLGLVVEHKEGDKVSIVDAVSGGRPNKATYMRAKGFQFIAKIAMSRKQEGYDSKLEIAYGSTIYIPNDPSAKDMGINKEAWALAANHSSQQPPPAAAMATPEPAVDPADGRDDL